MHGNVIKSRKYLLNENYFDNIDNESKAYFLGFLYADGYINEKIRTCTLALISKDVDILEKLRNCIGSSKPLYFSKGKKYGTRNNSDRYILSITSSNIISKLKSLGCTQGKSLTLEFPKIEQVPDELIAHFIRGYFDGDGCITGNFIKRKFKFCLVGTENFLTEVQRILVDKLQLNNIKLYRQGNISYLSYTGIPQCKKIERYLYKDATIFLGRKFDKFKMITNA